MSDASACDHQSEAADVKLILISLLRRNPCLYDPENANYKNRVVEDKTWAQISKEIGVPDFDARKEWTINLRVYADYHRDRPKLPSGSGAPSTTSGGKKRKSGWTYAAKMQFNLPHLGQYWQMESTMRRSSGSKEGSASSATSDTVALATQEANIDEDFITPQPPTPKNGRKQHAFRHQEKETQKDVA